ncbi:MAG: phenylalanine--tRNA ligase subunit beta [Coxiella endosymbiont of Haemaphysalis qinghaiensis]
MKLSETWLREWVNPSVNTEHLAEQLTLFGLEVDSVSPVAHSFEKVVVGEVLSAKKHPDTDRLFFCQVNVGKNKALKIVCGAANVRSGLKVPVALIGGQVGDLKIKKTKLRGVASHGMICSERELGFSEDRNGSIMELPSDAPVGKDLHNYLQLKDSILNIGLTPNRGDCASVRGIANEIGAINRISVRAPKIASVAPVIDAIFPIRIQAKEACPHYVGRIIRNVDNNTQTPLWMRERLRRSGLRSIRPVVDVMNYIMLEWGQPMHAFDYDQLSDEICVRYANPDEKITLIDGTEVTLNNSTLVIADKNQVHAIAGIMGGANSAINEKTKNIFLESAYFIPSYIALTARHYGLNTDSSYRFERGVDFQLQKIAIEGATELLLAITGGKPGPIEDQRIEETFPSIKKVDLHREQIKRLLGVEIADKEVHQILSSLGMTLQSKVKGWRVTVPSYRFDITQEVDLIEEVARLHGYERIPQTTMKRKIALISASETEVSLARIRHLMVDQGYNEVVNYSFVDDKLQNKLNPNLESLALSNPITNDMNVMRNSLWSGLVTVAKHNQSRQIERVRLFEIGECFIKSEGKWQQITKMACLIFGNAHNLQWGWEELPVDFYDLKGDISALLLLNRSEKNFRFVRAERSSLHPGKCAALFFKERCIGYLGALHPMLVGELNFVGTPYLFETELEAITKATLPHYQSISKFPTVRRDLAIIVDRDVEVSQIKEEIAQSAGHLLIMSEIFDIYEGIKHIESFKKSVAMALIFQDPSRTLIDEEIEQVIERVIAALERKFNAKLRT